MYKIVVKEGVKKILRESQNAVYLQSTSVESMLKGMDNIDFVEIVI